MVVASLLQKAFDFIYRVPNEEEEGQGLVEYALILVLIAVVSITVLGTLGTRVSGIFQEIQDGLGG